MTSRPSFIDDTNVDDNSSRPRLQSFAPLIDGPTPKSTNITDRVNRSINILSSNNDSSNFALPKLLAKSPRASREEQQQPSPSRSSASFFFTPGAASSTFTSNESSPRNRHHHHPHPPNRPSSASTQSTAPGGVGGGGGGRVDSVVEAARLVQKQRLEQLERQQQLEACVPLSKPSLYSVPAVSSSATNVGKSLSVLVNQTLCRFGGLSSSWLHLVFARVPAVECVPSCAEIYSRACIEAEVEPYPAFRQTLSTTPGRYNLKVLDLQCDASFGTNLSHVKAIVPLLHHNRHSIEDLQLQCSGLDDDGLAMILEALVVRDPFPTATRDHLAMALHDNARLTRLTENGGRYSDESGDNVQHRGLLSSTLPSSSPTVAAAAASSSSSSPASRRHLNEEEGVGAPQAGGLQDQLKMEKLRNAVQKNVIDRGCPRLKRINLSCNLLVGASSWATTKLLCDFLRAHPKVTVVNTQHTKLDQEAVRNVVLHENRQGENDNFGYSFSSGTFASSARRRSSIPYDRRGSSAGGGGGLLQRADSASAFYSATRRSLNNGNNNNSSSTPRRNTLFLGDDGDDNITSGRKASQMSLSGLRAEREKQQQIVARRMARSSSSITITPPSPTSAAAAARGGSPVRHAAVIVTSPTATSAAAGKKNNTNSTLLTKEQFDNCVDAFRSYCNPYSGLIEMARVSAKNPHLLHRITAFVLSQRTKVEERLYNETVKRGANKGQYLVARSKLPLAHIKELSVELRGAESQAAAEIDCNPNLSLESINFITFLQATHPDVPMLEIERACFRFCEWCHSGVEGSKSLTTLESIPLSITLEALEMFRNADKKNTGYVSLADWRAVCTTDEGRQAADFIWARFGLSEKINRETFIPLVVPYLLRGY